MPSFKKEFMQSKGQPIEYNGETIALIDYVIVPKQFTVSVRLISTNSEWTQIIRLLVNKDGYLLCNGQKGNDFALYESTMPPVVELSGYAPDGRLKVYNAWEREDWMGNNTVDAWVNGAAMKKVVTGNTIRYYCNDGHPDDNFDDIVFEITVL